MKGQLYQLLDSDGEQYGLVYSEDPSMNSTVMEEKWKEYYNDDELDEIDVDNFCDWLQSCGFEADRVYSQEINP